ncbi:MAG: hypothetical protein ACOH2M_03695 [Cypionkella sp.]
MKQLFASFRRSLAEAKVDGLVRRFLLRANQAEPYLAEQLINAILLAPGPALVLRFFA